MKLYFLQKQKKNEFDKADVNLLKKIGGCAVFEEGDN